MIDSSQVPKQEASVHVFPIGAPEEVQWAWIDAWYHLDTIATHQHGYIRELTTGCTCRDAPGWYPGRPDNPTCPVHGRCLRPSDSVGFETPPPCTCRYGLFDVVGAPAPYEQLRTPGIRRPRWATRCFTVDDRCPHHGDGARVPPDPFAGWRLHEFVLDEQERSGQ